MKSCQDWSDMATSKGSFKNKYTNCEKLISMGKWLFLSSKQDGCTYILRCAEHFIHSTKVDIISTERPLK